MTDDQASVVLLINGVRRGALLISEGCRYLRCASDAAGRVLFCGQGQNDGKLMVGGFHADGSTFIGYHASGYVSYSQPGIWFDGSDWILFALQTSTSYVRLRYLESAYQIFPCANTSQGWIQCAVNGVEDLRWIDANRTKAIRGTTIYLGNQVGDYLFGQDPARGLIGIGIDAGDPFLACDGYPQEPRAAWDAVQQQYVVASWQGGSVVSVIWNIVPPFVPIPPKPQEPSIPVEVAPFTRKMLIGNFEDDGL
jgi:hypothetical protein